MSKKVLLLISALFLISGCDNKEVTYGSWVSLNENQHQKFSPETGEKVVEDHKWSNPTVLSEPTHFIEGSVEYTCSECGETKVQSISKLEEHVFDQCVVKPEYLKWEATCERPAEYFKSCLCGEKSTESFTYGSKLNHVFSKITLETNPTKMNYVSYETMNLDGAKLIATCTRCGNFEIPLDEVTFTYKDNRNSFRVGDDYVNAHYQGKSLKIEGINVAKANNTFVNFRDLEISCHESIDLNDFKAVHGNTTIVVKDKDENVVTDLTKLEKEYSPYTLHASCPASEEIEALEDTAIINVTHDICFDEVNYEDACVCGAYRIRNYFYNLDKNELYLDGLDGLDKDSLAGYTIVDSETNEAPDFSNLKGGESLNLIATKDDDVIHFKGIAINKVITTKEEFAALSCPVGTKTSTKEELTFDGYYVLGNDITGPISMGTPMDDVKGYYGISTTPSGANYLDYCKAHYFKATVNGLGHKVSKLTNNAHVYVGIFGGSLDGATIKNITFDEVNSGWGNNGGNYQLQIFGGCIRKTTFENMNIKLVGSSGNFAGSGSCSVLGYQFETGCSFINVNVDLNNLSVTGTSLGFFMFAGAAIGNANSAPYINGFTVTNLKQNETCYFVREMPKTYQFDAELTGFTGVYKGLAA